MATRVLLVEDDSTDAFLFRRYLKRNDRHGFELEHAGELKAGIERLREGEFEVVLLDLDLPDSRGFDTFFRIHQEAPDVAIIVLTGNDDEDLALLAVREGAQDYLLKGDLTGPLLVRAIRYAIERHHMHRELVGLSLTDELTGLYNRRGLRTLAEQQLREAHRDRTQMALIFADLDNLKDINDKLGHGAGNDALVEAAHVLRRSVRDSDIVARVGGDEFVIMLVNAREDGFSVPVGRLRENVGRANDAPDRAFALSMSFGCTVRRPDDSRTLNELVDEADRAMYQEKRTKKKPAAE